MTVVAALAATVDRVDGDVLAGTMRGFIGVGVFVTVAAGFLIYGALIAVDWRQTQRQAGIKPTGEPVTAEIEIEIEKKERKGEPAKVGVTPPAPTPCAIHECLAPFNRRVKVLNDGYLDLCDGHATLAEKTNRMRDNAASN